MKYLATIFEQTTYKIISTVLPFETIFKNSKTLIYGVDEGGYQRIQDRKHYLNIKNYILSNNFIFPNSIILAVDQFEIDSILNNENGIFYLNIENDSYDNNKLFRVVDGQHRLLGLKEASSDKPEILKLMLSVNIICTPPNRRSVEMEIFGNINSKAKRLKTDLIELAKYDFRIIEDKIGKKELNDHIAINLAYNLNENTIDNNVWQNAIKIDIHSNNKIGIVSITAFKESVSGIVSSYINLNQQKIDTLNEDETILFSREAAKILEPFMIKAWETVYDKWIKSFDTTKKELDIDDQYKSIKYNPNFYVQKTLGCKSINYILTEILKNKFENKFNEESLVIFKEIISKSKLIASDWEIGKTLSGYSSESGFNKVSSIIKNIEPFTRKE